MEAGEQSGRRRQEPRRDRLFATVAQGADSVDVSPLGKALTGAAAKVFEKLDGKARDMLEGYVKSGVLTADDVVKGLRGIAKEAVDARYRREAPRTSEEMELGEKLRSVNERKMNYFRELSGIAHSFSQQSEQVDKENSGEEDIRIRHEQIDINRSSAVADHKKTSKQNMEVWMKLLEKMKL